MTTAKHAFRGTMKALQELGLNNDSQVQTVDEAAKDIAKSTVEDVPNSLNQQSHLTESIFSVDPKIICNWEFHDRPQGELGDLSSFAQELKEVGQQQPAIVRPHSKSKKYKYEIIAGERRWRAALLAKIGLKVIVKNLTDSEAAICQASENSQRKDLSDYAKGINYKQLLDRKIISQKDLEVRLRRSKTHIMHLLSFSRISNELIAVIPDISKISARTAYEIARLEAKGKEFKEALFLIAPKIKEDIGAKRLIALVNAVLSTDKEKIISAKEVKSKNGRHLFTWKNDSNGAISIAFPKNIRENINFSQLEDYLIQAIDTLLDDQINNP